MKLLVKRRRFDPLNLKKSVKAAAKYVTSQHTANPSWSQKTKMKSSAIIVRKQAISSPAA
jgi:hypothetical protein